MSCCSSTPRILRYGLAMLGVMALHGCATFTLSPHLSGNYSGLSPPDALKKAQWWEARVTQLSEAGARADAWMNCAVLAHDAMASQQTPAEIAAATLATRCTHAYISATMQGMMLNVHPGRMLLGGSVVEVQFRGLPDSLGDHLHLELADQLSMDMLGGVRYLQSGFGVPVVAAAPPCTDRPICSLYPPEGVFRPATVWLEGTPGAAHTDEAPVLVVQGPVAKPLHTVGAASYRLAADLSAPYEQLLERTKLRRLGWWGLIGGQSVGRRSGLILLDDYDPAKTPVIMIHGLGSSPLVWAPLSNAIIGDAELHRRYQIWHIVYQTNAPLLVERHRVQTYIDTAWRILDPDGHAPARQGGVLIGHSMGGVIARLLCAQSIPALWSSAFTAPFSDLRGNADDLALLKAIFEFKPYPGIDEAIFIAAPQHGSPAAGYWFGKLAQDLAWRHIPEMSGLVRISNDNPKAIQSSLLTTYRVGRLSSVSSLLPDEPVSMVDDTLMPTAGVRYHTIAGSLPGQHPPGDGYVPLSSALLTGSASTLIVPAGHHALPGNAQVMDAVLAILRQHGSAH